LEQTYRKKRLNSNRFKPGPPCAVLFLYKQEKIVTDEQANRKQRSILRKKIGQTGRDISHAKSRYQGIDAAININIDSMQGYQRAKANIEDEDAKRKLDEKWANLFSINEGLKKDSDYWKDEKLRLDGVLEGLKEQMRNLLPAPNNAPNNAPNINKSQNQFDVNLPEFSAMNVQGTEQVVAPTTTTPLHGQPATAVQPNSLLVTRNDTAISEQETQDARERKKLKNLYPSMSKPKLPPLVRRDGQELSTAEKMYPAMGYNEDEYEPWSDDAVAMAITKYPDVAKNESVARRLAAANPIAQPAEDEEEYRLPLNPTLADLARHDQSKRKKLW
jgi:hypothetical protein